MSGQGISLYVGLLSAVDTPQMHDACFATLSLEERQRAERFVLDRHRREYIFAHGLLRMALSDFSPRIKPSDWSFTTNRYGRPFVAAPATGRTAYFSLSHTDGCVACSVAGHRAVGVDVERVQARDSLLETALTAFSPEEIEILRHLAPSDFVDRFFDYWTLKEAYLKAKGSGLSLPLDQFSILMSPDKITIKFMPGIIDDPRRWHFTRISPSASYRRAIADGSGAIGGLPIVMQSWPLPSRIHAP